MPMYDYECEECGHTFEFLAKSTQKKDREKPTKEPCPECGVTGKVIRHFGTPNIAEGMNKRKRIKDHGWKETLQKIKQHHPRGYIKGID